MHKRFSTNIAPFVEQELAAARQARAVDDASQEFAHFELGDVQLGLDVFSSGC